MAKNRHIPVDTYGTADFVSEVEIAREARWGGFLAQLCASHGPVGGETILLSATRWTGPQPRLVLECGGEGYQDWREVLERSPEDRHTICFVGSPLADRGWGQWLTMGPSPLIGNKKYLIMG